MICLVCRNAQTLNGHISINFERDEFKAVIKRVPAQVCPACGEAYLAEDVTEEVLIQAEKLSHEGMAEIVQDYA